MSYPVINTKAKIMEITLKKVHTNKDLIISAIVVAAGIGLFFLNGGLGGVIAACGLLMFLLYKGGYKREGENIVLTKKTPEVARSCYDSLKDYLDGKDVEPVFKNADGTGMIRLEVYYNAEAAVAYAQLFTFSNYSYVEETPIVELRGPRAEKLIKLL